MADNQHTGNIAERAIALELQRIGEVRAVTRIPNQDDPNHWDLLVTLRNPVACFHVQAKAYTQATRRFKVRHIKDWLHATLPTVPMWWDEGNRVLYWTDILRFLLRARHALAHGTATVNHHQDLHILNSMNPDSFVRWARERCVIWPLLGLNTSGSWPSDVEFPVSFVDVLKEPDILLYMPVSSRVVSVIDEYMGPKSPGRGHVAMEVLRSAPAAATSPRKAVSSLIHRFGLPDRDTDLTTTLRSAFEDWRERIPENRQIAAAKHLWAFDKLLSLVGFRRRGDLVLPAFESTHTYPVGNLVNLLPSELFIDPLLLILHTEHNPHVLLYAAWCFGILNHRPSAEIWRVIRQLRGGLTDRRRTIGPLWRLVDRQLLYTEAQLGSEQAQIEYLRRLSRQDAGHFEAAFNFRYYGGDRSAITRRFEKRLEERVRTDTNVHQIASLIYRHLRPRLARDVTTMRAVSPELWPVE